MRVENLQKENEVIELAKRSTSNVASLLRRDFSDYRVSIEKELRDKSASYLLKVDSDNKQIMVSNEEYKRLELQKDPFGEQFPKLALSYSISSTFALDAVREVVGFDFVNIFEVITRGATTVDPESFSLRIAERMAMANALLKISSLMVLHKNSGTKSWARFADKNIGAMFAFDFASLEGKERDRSLVVPRVDEEVASAQQNFVDYGNFSEYTLRFLDKINNKTTAECFQMEVLSDIMARALLNQFPKKVLAEQIDGFFDKQYVKQRLLATASQASVLGLQIANGAQIVLQSN